jgi:small-conductance mechanosensitive channel
MARLFKPSRLLELATLAAAIALLSIARTPSARAESSGSSGPEAPAREGDFGTAQVRVDGHELFRVHGTANITAQVRAHNIAERIAAAAADSSVSPDSLVIVENPSGSQIVVGDHPLVTISEPDARLERLTPPQLARQCLDRLQKAIREYRFERSPASLFKSTLSAIAISALLVVFLTLLLWARRRVTHGLEGAFQKRVSSLKRSDVQLEQTRRVWTALDNVVSLAVWLVGGLMVVIYLERVLGLFPWTREAASDLLGYLISPLRMLGEGFVGWLPNLFFLLVLALITRLILRLLAFVAEAIQREALTIKGFDPDWGWPTYRIVRTVVLLFSVVVAYPFIPGSNTEAFKGVSIFVGVLVSLGSTSVIGNLLSGYTMIYRRAFRVGDRVLIDNQFGEVMEIRVTVTHLRSPKNEEIILPNSLIMNSKVTNYTTLAKKRGLILHTNVGIGYETPWRQVEAMLIMAAERTPGIAKDPPPYVLQRGLGDFAIDYEINAYTEDASRMLLMYADLHRNILDLFNEYNVQIMTPAYVADPQSAKVVPRSKWNTQPAATSPAPPPPDRPALS